MKPPGTIRSVALILLLLVLLPLLFFSAFQISRLGASESAIAEIYSRQLYIVLFSINQYAWDVANTWASAVERAWEPSRTGGKLPAEFTAEFLARNSAIDELFVADSLGASIGSLAGRGGDAAAQRARLRDVLSRERITVERLLTLSARSYRKIEPLTLSGPSRRDGAVMLLFVLRSAKGTAALAGMTLHEERFVREVLGERMREAAADEYVLWVLRASGGERLYASEEGEAAEPEVRRQLWLFPDLEAGIRLKGETIQQVARARAVRDLAVLLVLDALLITGVWVVYRSVRREMEFVRMKSDFVSSVSHDLRTPLALIRMYAETLSLGRLRGEQKKKEYYDTIVRETERLTRLVNNLLNFSRMEAGRRPYTLLPLDLNALVEGVLDAFAPHLKSEGIVPDAALSRGLPGVAADSEAVQEALINILDNAVKYGGREKFLRVATGRTPDHAYVEVTDHGPGIPREYHERIFETFFRVPAPREGNPRGSGLGLAIARHIMEAHGGRIILESTPGTGSTFRLEFPYEHNTGH